MAKFGNFVGKKDLELTNEEKEMFMNLCTTMTIKF